jgi:exopolysaccharide biosynthesis polyprenyl glycosylphosphotransferase
MGHHGSQLRSDVSDLLGKELVAAPPDSRARRRLELPEAIRRERVGFGERSFDRLPVVVDMAMLVVASVATRLLSLAFGLTLSPVVWDLLFFSLVMSGFGLRGSYRPRIRPHFLDDLRATVSATAVATMAVISVRVAVTDDIHAAVQTTSLWMGAVGCLATGRLGLFIGRARAIRNGAGKPTLIVGAGRIGNLVARRLLQRPEFGLRPVGFLDHDPLEIEGARAPLPVLGASWNLEEVIAAHDVQHVIFTFSTAPHNVLLGMVRRCQEMGVTTSLVPRLFEAAVERVTVEHLGGLPLFAMRPSDPKGWQFAVKYTLDRAVAAILLLLLSPLMLALALTTRASIGRSIFFRQRRVGLDGREFEILKFRTMKNGPPPAELNGHANGNGQANGNGHATGNGHVNGIGHITIRANGNGNGNLANGNGNGQNGSGNGFGLSMATAPGGVEGADRRTRIGRVLRKTSLDELPQLINVLRGEMSLIGPRPERPEFVELFGEDVHRYRDRHRVKSGITGWAQIHGLRGQTSISDRAEWDNYYIENWSLWLDFKIALMTLPCLLRGAGE